MLKIIVGIATIGRADVLRSTVEYICAQIRQADRIVVSHHTDRDIEGIPSRSLGITCVKSPAGLTKQRNTILRVAQEFDVVSFFDDDFFPSPKYLQVIEECFLSQPDYQVVTGALLADGINGPGIDPGTAAALIATDGGAPNPMHTREIYNGYGCNMSVRLSEVLRHRISFDENLPMYGWLEDVDFCRRLRKFGKIVRIDGARGVHLGVKSGRTRGVRLGYSQIANPIYLFRRGTLSWRRAFLQMVKNFCINAARAEFPEPYVDRMGRLRGNMAALVDLSRGRCHPMRMLEF